jgi:hypothetical protein
MSKSAGLRVGPGRFAVAAQVERRGNQATGEL